VSAGERRARRRGHLLSIHNAWRKALLSREYQLQLRALRPCHVSCSFAAFCHHRFDYRPLIHARGGGALDLGCSFGNRRRVMAVLGSCGILNLLLYLLSEGDYDLAPVCCRIRAHCSGKYTSSQSSCTTSSLTDFLRYKCSFLWT
jgi:hypothetical protein